MFLVAGSTGHLGTEIVRLLRDRGEAVRALVRASSAPEKVDHLQAMGAETVVGDLKDRASLEKACSGVRTVISTVTMIATGQPGDSFQDTDKAGTISLIDAAKAAGAEHFVFISFDTERFPATPLTDAKRAVGSHLRSSGIAYTILQPTLFMEIWLGPMLFGDLSTGQVKIFGHGNGKVSYVSLTDVALVAVYAATTASARNQTITFGGPEGVTQREAVGLFEEAVGKPLTVTEVPEPALEAQWRSAENPLEKTFAGLMLGIARLDEDPSPTDDRIPERKKTVKDFARQRAESA